VVGSTKRGFARRAQSLGATLLLGLSLVACSTTTAGHGARSGGALTRASISASSASSTPPGSTTASSAPSATGVSPSVTPTTVAQLGATLEAIALTAADFGTRGDTFDLIENGDQVAGETTLDACGITFTTEAKRVARRQYWLDDASGNDAGFSNELVAYDSPTGASNALAEWHHAAANCPSTPVKSSDGDYVEAFTRNDLNVAGLPAAHNAITVSSITGQDFLDYEIVVTQLSGRYLDIVYGELDQAPTADDLAMMTRFATITGQRLMAHS
jgi:hypothetical protein